MISTGESTVNRGTEERAYVFNELGDDVIIAGAKEPLHEAD